MALNPDVAGFRDAQRRLRATLGVDVVFTIPGESSWPPDTPLDPQTGRPHDPFLEPTAPVVDRSELVRCSFVHHPLVGLDPADTPIGSADVGSAALIVDVADYPRVADATRAQVGPEIYDVQAFRHDVALGVERYIAYLEHA
jgi:hypothetical protein